jgi:ubiquinone/menaquinone biosynthesis C-methylase UbiE
MAELTSYVLGQSARAARRLEIQDRQFAEPSERLLDDLALRPDDQVVELGCGPGGFTRRILARLGPSGVVVGVDAGADMLKHAQAALAGAGPARFQPEQADVDKFGSWLAGADVVVGRAVLHHVPMAEGMVGRLRATVPPGTRVGFIEPDFRTPLARIAYLEATGRPELAPLVVWARAINQLYQTRRISPAVGATLGSAMSAAGYRNVRTAYHACPSDPLMVENMVMFYDEVRQPLQAYGILSEEEVDRQQELLQALSAERLPAAWGVFRVVAEV